MGSAFTQSAIKSIVIPSTLKTVEEGTFSGCKDLKTVKFAGKVERICKYAFCRSGVERVIFPSSLREVAQGSFAFCNRLTDVELNEGLTVLGTDDEDDCGVFEGSALQNVDLPSTLKRIERRAF